MLAIKSKENKEVKTRLLFAVVCMLFLPIFLSPSVGDKQINSAPFVTVVMAGHVTPLGYYCECGSSSDCICDEGESSVITQTASDRLSKNGSTGLSGARAANGVDLGAGAMIFALALLLGLRMRF